MPKPIEDRFQFKLWIEEANELIARLLWKELIRLYME